MSEPTLPRVSVIFASKDRPEELKRTLAELKKQNYPDLEIIVVDDASAIDLGPVVRHVWSDATVLRNAVNVGQAAARTRAMQIATGKYILTLDDDSCLTDPEDLARAVHRLEGDPRIGVLSFFIWSGVRRPPARRDIEQELLAPSFTAGGALLRSEVIHVTGGFQPFFRAEWEEEELSLRILDAGWSIVFFPAVLVHHRLSSINRAPARTWAYGLRNKLWSMVMHMPARNLALEFGWKFALGVFDAFRLARPQWWAWALISFARGLPSALRLRHPMTRVTYRRYSAVRFRTLTPCAGSSLEPIRLGEYCKWFVHVWWRRPRNRSFWDVRSRTDIGTCVFAAYPHEEDGIERR